MDFSAFPVLCQNHIRIRDPVNDYMDMPGPFRPQLDIPHPPQLLAALPVLFPDCPDKFGKLRLGRLHVSRPLISFVCQCREIIIHIKMSPQLPPGQLFPVCLVLLFHLLRRWLFPFLPPHPRRPISSHTDFFHFHGVQKPVRSSLMSHALVLSLISLSRWKRGCPL